MARENLILTESQVQALERIIQEINVGEFNHAYSNSNFAHHDTLETWQRFTERYYIAASFRYLNTDFEDGGVRYDGAEKTMGLVVGYAF